MNRDDPSAASGSALDALASKGEQLSVDKRRARDRAADKQRRAEAAERERAQRRALADAFVPTPTLAIALLTAALSTLGLVGAAALLSRYLGNAGLVLLAMPLVVLAAPPLMRRAREWPARGRRDAYAAWLEGLPFPVTLFVQTVASPDFWFLELRLAVKARLPPLEQLAHALVAVAPDVLVELRSEEAVPPRVLIRVFPGPSLTRWRGDRGWVAPWFRRVAEQLLIPLHEEAEVTGVGFTQVQQPTYKDADVAVDNRKGAR